MRFFVTVVQGAVMRGCPLIISKVDGMKINILGTDYDLKEDKSIIDVGVDGLCREYSKEILIRPCEEMLSSNDGAEDKGKRYREVMRHEIIHAFFSESGLDGYSNNEQLVNWLAIQIPKMNDVFAILKVGDK